MKHNQSILLFIIILALAQINCRSVEQPYRNYATTQDAIQAGERNRGWLPVCVPYVATEIHIQNNIDTQELWIRFNLQRNYSDSLKSILSPAKADTVKVTRPAHASWWFEALIEQAPADDAALYSELFVFTDSSSSQSYALAFDKESNSVFIWSL